MSKRIDHELVEQIRARSAQGYHSSSDKADLLQARYDIVQLLIQLDTTRALLSTARFGRDTMTQLYASEQEKVLELRQELEDSLLRERTRHDEVTMLMQAIARGESDFTTKDQGLKVSFNLAVKQRAIFNEYANGHIGYTNKRES